MPRLVQLILASQLLESEQRTLHPLVIQRSRRPGRSAGTRPRSSRRLGAGLLLARGVGRDAIQQLSQCADARRNCGAVRAGAVRDEERPAVHSTKHIFHEPGAAARANQTQRKDVTAYTSKRRSLWLQHHTAHGPNNIDTLHRRSSGAESEWRQFLSQAV